MKSEFNNHKKVNNILLTACGSLFLLLIFILSYYNRFALDDYYHIHVVAQKGISGAMLDGYNSYGGRWASYLLWGLVYYFYDAPWVTALYSLLVFLLFGLAIFLLLRNFICICGFRSLSKSILNYSLLLTAMFFFASGNKGEIWFWIVSTAMYMNSLTAFIFILIILTSTRNKSREYLFLIPLSVFAGGAAETYAAVFFTFILLLIILKCAIKRDILSNISVVKLIIVLVFMGAAFAISVMAPGNMARAGWLPDRSLTATFLTTLISLKDLIFSKILHTIPYIILFSLPWIAAGQTQSDIQNSISFRKYFSILLISGLLLLVLCYLIMFPTCYLLSEICPFRTLSPVILLICLYAASWAFLTGYYNMIPWKFERYTNKIVLILILGFLIYTIISQFNQVSAYSSALDKRIEHLKTIQIKDKDHIEYVDPLPASGFLYSAEISLDTACFINKHFSMGVFAEYRIALKQ